MMYVINWLHRRDLLSDDVIRDLLSTHPHLAKYLSTSEHLADLPLLNSEIMDDLSLRFNDFLSSTFKQACLKQDFHLCSECMKRMNDLENQTVHLDEKEMMWLLSEVAEKGDLRLLLRLSEILPHEDSSRIDELLHQLMLSTNFTSNDFNLVLRHGKVLTPEIWKKHDH